MNDDGSVTTTDGENHNGSPTAAQANGSDSSAGEPVSPRRLKLVKGVKYGFYFGDNILSPLEVVEQTDDGWVTVSGDEGSKKRTFHINLANVTYIEVAPKN